MFWGYLLLTLKLSILPFITIFVIYFICGYIARLIRNKNPTESIELSIIGLNDNLGNILFCAPSYIVLFAAGMSINSNVVKWIIIVLISAFLLYDTIHWVIETISFFAAPKGEKLHVLMHSAPFTIALYIWLVLGYNMLHNFRITSI